MTISHLSLPATPRTSATGVSTAGKALALAYLAVCGQWSNSAPKLEAMALFSLFSCVRARVCARACVISVLIPVKL